MVLLSHPTGNAFVREVALSLENSGVLGEFHTSIASCGGNIFEKLSRLPGLGEIRRRSMPARLRPKLKLHPLREAFRLALARLGPNASAVWGNGFCGIDAIYSSLDHAVSRRVGSGNFRAVYCYEDGALETFRAAKACGLKCIYDLPIAYWKAARRLLAEEAERLPEWACTLDGLRDQKEKLQRKDDELFLADTVVVPSNFVRDSLPQDVLEQKHIVVVPFGSPEVMERTRVVRGAGPLKILFAGSMTQRKGLGDLFLAMTKLDPKCFELHVLGAPAVGIDFYQRQTSGFIHHSTRSNLEVLELMRSCDVFVLPSIVEGRALVQQEAMSCGLPIIVTKNAGAEDLLEDGKAGFLVPIRSPEAIAEKLEILNRDRGLLASMSSAAKEKANQLTWASYRVKISEVVRSIISAS
jgi:glycosyltransferase involved in cell wall biosynthesis